MDERLIIADKTQGWAHVSIPKCGCQSIRRALESHLKLPPGHTVNGRKWPCRLSLDELKRSPNLFRWSVVRDPRARLVSTWAEKTQRMLPDGMPGLAACYRPFLGKPFAEFAEWATNQPVNTSESEIHIRACSWWLYDGDTCVVDDVYDLGNIGPAWDAMRRRFGFPELGHRNKSNHKPWREYYTPAIEDAVRSAYAADFAAWFQTKE